MSSFQDVKDYMVQYKKLLLYEKDVASKILEGQHYINKEISCFNTRLEDVEMNTIILIGEMEDIRRIMTRMEHSQMEKFNGMHNFLMDMQSFM